MNLSSRLDQENIERPISLTLLSLLISFIGAMYLTRLIQTLRQWNFLNNLPDVPVGYLAVSGAIWGVTGIGLGISLWLGLVWARKSAIPLILGFSGFYWLERILLVDTTDRNSVWLFGLVVNLICIIWAFWVLNRRKVKLFFGDVDI